MHEVVIGATPVVRPLRGEHKRSGNEIIDVACNDVADHQVHDIVGDRRLRHRTEVSEELAGNKQMYRPL